MRRIVSTDCRRDIAGCIKMHGNPRMEQQQPRMLRVWDPVVRVGHWTLVASFFVAYFTEEDFLALHVWAGYVLGGVVAFRLLWGFIGTRHARFSDFLHSPSRIVEYLRGLRQGRAAHYVGHNPAGGVMIVLLLISLSATVYTGLELYTIEEGAGPLAALRRTEELQGVPLPGASTHARGESVPELPGQQEAEEKEGEEFWEGLHEFLANFTLMLVIVHVCGAVASSYLHHENLIIAMITGNKIRQ